MPAQVSLNEYIRNDISKTPLSKIQLSLKTFGIIIGAVGILHGGAELVQG